MIHCGDLIVAFSYLSVVVGITLSSYMENRILNKMLRGEDFTVAPVYVSLHTADPLDDGSNELSGMGYVRQLVDMDEWSSAEPTGDGGQSENLASVNFTNLPAATITHVGLWDAESDGNFLWGGVVNPPIVVSAGQPASFKAGALKARLN